MLNSVLKKISPEVEYKNGFIVKGRRLPYYPMISEVPPSGWSDEMAEDLREHTKEHFIDVYNRKIALEGVTAKLRPANVYIDCGCSSGYLLEEVQEMYPEVVLIGMDYFQAGLLHCFKRLPTVPLFQVDLTNTRVPSEIADAVTCLNVLEHIREDGKAIFNIVRMLKPGGLLSLTVPAGPSLYDLYDEIHYHERRYDLKTLVAKFRTEGLDILRANYFGTFIYPAFYCVKRLNRLRYGKLTFEQKKAIAFRQIRRTERSRFMEGLCQIEYLVGKKVRYPFGIRIYLNAKKR